VEKEHKNSEEDAATRRREQRNGNRSGKGKPRRCSRVPMTTREEAEGEEEEAKCNDARKGKGQKGYDASFLSSTLFVNK
jgi:hypothetical protein